MNSERWPDVADELARARELSDADRAAHLGELDARDHELATEVRRLLGLNAMHHVQHDHPFRHLRVERL